jgi:hypothetical protein
MSRSWAANVFLGHILAFSSPMAFMIESFPSLTSGPTKVRQKIALQWAHDSVTPPWDNGYDEVHHSYYSCSRYLPLNCSDTAGPELFREQSASKPTLCLLIDVSAVLSYIPTGLHFSVAVISLVGCYCMHKYMIV